MNVLAALVASLPCISLVRGVQRRMAWERGADALWRTFLFGALGTLLVLASAPVLAHGILPAGSPYARGLAAALLRAAAPEEIVKFLVVLLAIRRGHVRDARAGVAHGIAASLGLAAVESSLFALQLGAGAVALRVFTAVPFHAATGALMGSLAGHAARRRLGPASRLLPALVLPMGLHVVYDFPLMVLSEGATARTPFAPEETCALGLATLAALGGTCLAGFRAWRAEFPREERRNVGRALRFAVNLAGSGVIAWVLVPVGGVVASVGASIVGSLVVFGDGVAAADPTTERVVFGFQLLGAALFCVGMALGSMGLRARRRAAG